MWTTRVRSPSIPICWEAAGILPYELVQVLDITNGARLETYAIEGERGSGEVCVNGAAGLLVRERDLIIVLHFLHMSEEDACRVSPASCVSMPETASSLAPTASKRVVTTRS